MAKIKVKNNAPKKSTGVGWGVNGWGGCSNPGGACGATIQMFSRHLSLASLS